MIVMKFIIQSIIYYIQGCTGVV